MSTRRPTGFDRVVGSLDDEPFSESDDELFGVNLAVVGARVRALIESKDAHERRGKLASAEAEMLAARKSLEGRRTEPKKTRAELQAELRRLAVRGGQLMLQQYQMKFESASDADLVHMIAEAKHALGEE